MESSKATADPMAALSSAQERSPVLFRTMQDTVVAALRARILRGDLKPGQRIIERVIAGELAISKTPVREALTQLEGEGWVKITPHKGAIVTALSLKELKEIYLVRIHLEGLATRLAAERISEATVQTLRALVAKMEPLGLDQIDEFMALQAEFHNVFYRSSDHLILCELLDSLRHRSLRYRWAYMDLAESRTRMLNQRRLLLNMLSDKVAAENIQATVEANLAHNCELLEKEMQAP
jgi:DNA-binding GntR family transcriptional regulator